MPKVRKSTTLKFAAVALGVAGIVGLTISSAASLNLTGGSVGASSSVVAACQTSTTGTPPTLTPITVSVNTGYDATLGGYIVTNVALGAVDAACAGENVKVTLSGASNAKLGEWTGIAAAGSATTLTLVGTPTPLVSAKDVSGTAVVIYN
jgi:hypothetical protein